MERIEGKRLEGRGEIKMCTAQARNNKGTKRPRTRIIFFIEENSLC